MRNYFKKVILTAKTQKLRTTFRFFFKRQRKTSVSVYTALECRLTIDRSNEDSKMASIIIKEHISAFNIRLLKDARKFSEIGIINFAWFQNANVLIRKAPNSKIIKIKSFDDLKNAIE